MKYRAFLAAILAFSMNAAAQCPDLPKWVADRGLQGAVDGACNVTVDGVSFDARESLYDVTIEGTLSPGFGNYPDIWQECSLGNVLYSNVVRQNADPGGDLISPGFNSFIRHFVIKDSVLQGTKHLLGGHEDILQAHKAISGGGWLVLQNTLAKNADTNMFMSIGTGDRGYGNGSGDDYRCPDSKGTGGILFQGLTVAPNDPGYTGPAQISIGDPTSLPLPEVWLVDTHYSGLGINFIDTVGKVIVIGGSGGTKGWPGPLKPRRANGDTMTAANCPAGGWNASRGYCCPNGLVNAGGQVFSWQEQNAVGDNPANGAIPIYCYDDIETALADGTAGHKAPIFLDWSKCGWRGQPSCTSGGGGEPEPESTTLTISPESGYFIKPVRATITADNPTARIHYTLDGANPAAASNLYAGPIPIENTTTLKAAAFSADGQQQISATYQEEYNFDTFRAGKEWQGIPYQFPEEFLFSYRYTPGQNPQDVVLGFSDAMATSFNQLGAIVRFAPAGVVDVRNAGSYTAEYSKNYAADTTYLFKVLVDVPSKTYSVYVKESGAKWRAIAMNYQFRDSQLSVESFRHLNFYAESGSGLFGDFSVEEGDLTPKSPVIMQVTVN